MPNVLLTRLSVVTACALAWAGCTVHKTEAPDLAGPSEFALSFGVSASPDAISQDGGSQSAIVVKAFDANGKPKPSVTFRLDMFVEGTPVDYGTLSVKTVVTGPDGRAAATYTAPAPFPVGTNLPTCSPNVFTPGLPGGCLSIVATPIGTGFVSARSESVDIHLVPIGVILPNAPTAAFTFNPAAPSASAPVQFDASTSCAGQAGATGGCLSSTSEIVDYAWDFGDGATARGRLVTHAFTLQRTYSVVLTVSNDRGVKGSTTKVVTVGAGSAPTAAFVFSPTPVLVRGQVFFDASNSRPGIGHTITTYQWNWGDGDPTVSSGSPLQQHDFVSAGSYTVLLTVTDEAGQIGTATTTVSVALGAPGAVFTMMPSPASVGSPVTFDGLGSSSTSPIVRYEWNFGDLTPIVSTIAPTTTIQHTFGAPADYIVTLTVYNSSGVSNSATHTLKVQ